LSASLVQEWILTMYIYSCWWKVHQPQVYISKEWGVTKSWWHAMHSFTLEVVVEMWSIRLEFLHCSIASTHPVSSHRPLAVWQIVTCWFWICFSTEISSRLYIIIIYVNHAIQPVSAKGLLTKRD
jgi:hypothetical protein